METESATAGRTYPWWFFSPIILAPILLFLPALIPGRSLFWGITSIQFIPWHWEALQLIRAGEVPLWNVLNGMGSPLAANYQSCIFYPPTWLTFLAGWAGGLTWLAWSHGLLVAGHLVWAGWGMKKLMARLGLSPVPQLIGGLSYGLCGYLISRGSFLTMVQSAAWIPWILLAASQFASPIREIPAKTRGSLSPRPIIWLALAFSGQWLSGHAQLAWYTLLFCLAWLVSGALVNGGGKRLLQITIPIAISGLLGFLICSIQLVPTIEYFVQSQRSGAIDYQTALSYSFWPWRLITLIFPDIFGNPGAGDYWGYGSFWEDAVYFGLLPLVLAVYYVIRQVKQKRNPQGNPYQPLLWFCLISIFVVVILALGWNTPVFPWLFEHVLTFGFFNGPARWIILVEVCLILLAGLGAQEWMDHEILPRKWVNLGLTGVAAMILSAAAAWIFLPEIKLSFKSAVIASGILLAGYFTLALFKPKEHSASGTLWWRYLIIIWLAIDLIWAGSRLNPSVSADHYLVKHPQTENPQNAGRYYMSSVEEKSQRFDRFFRFEDIRPQTDWQKLTDSMLPDMNILANVPMLNNFDPMVPDRFSGFVTAIETASPKVQEALLSLAGVDHIARVDPLDIRDLVWTQRGTYPRARLVYCAEYADSSLQWLSSAAETDRLANTIMLENSTQTTSTCNNSVENMDGLNDLFPLSNRQEYQVVGNPADGWLFIADTWYPGWKAKLDGQPVEILRADYVFMAVPVPAGNHQIELEFQPDSFITGILLTGMGICVTIILGFFIKNSKGAAR